MRLAPELSHLQKEQEIKKYAKIYDLNFLVETGIFEGKMISGTHNFFEHIYSIELEKKYYDSAVEKFKGLPNVSIYNGNSVDVLKTLDILKNERCLIWLDAHDGKQSPALEELEVIFDMSKQEHVILIDDMRNFNIREGYPDISKLINLIVRKRAEWSVLINDDILRAGRLLDEE